MSVVVGGILYNKEVRQIKDLFEKIFGDSLDEEKLEEVLKELTENYVLKNDFEKLKLQNQEHMANEESYQKQIKDIRLQNAVDKALVACGAKNQKAVYALLDKEQLILSDDGNLSGIEEQIDSLKKSDAFLFGNAELKGLKPAEKADEAYKAPTEMTYTELCEYFTTKNN